MTATCHSATVPEPQLTPPKAELVRPQGGDTRQTCEGTPAYVGQDTDQKNEERKTGLETHQENKVQIEPAPAIGRGSLGGGGGTKGRGQGEFSTRRWLLIGQHAFYPHV